MAKILHTLSNGSLLDKTGNQTLTLTAGTSKGFVKSGIGKGGLDFDGADTTLPTTLTSNAGFQNGFTISAWIKPDSSGESNLGRIVGKAESGSLNGIDYFMNTAKVGLVVNGDVTRSSGLSSVSYGVWTHVLVTVASNATVTHYINGVVSGTPGATGALSGITTANPLTIGNRSGATDGTFDGLIQEVIVDNTVWTQAQINAEFSRFQQAKLIGNISLPIKNFVYPKPDSLNKSNLIAAYNFKPAFGTLVDISGNSLNATITGASSVMNNFEEGLNFRGAGASPETDITKAFLGTTTLFNGATQLSFRTRLKKIANPSSNGTIFAKGNVSTSVAGTHVQWIVGASGVIQLIVGDGSNVRTFQIPSGSVPTGIIFNLGVSLDLSTDTCTYYINNSSGTCSKSGTAIAAIQTGTVDTCIGLDGNNGNNRYGFNGSIYALEVSNATMTATEWNEWNNKYARQSILNETFDYGADGVAKAIPNWQVVSGTWKINELTTKDSVLNLDRGQKYLANVTAGILAFSSNQAYGTWEFDLYKGADGNDTTVYFISPDNTFSSSYYYLQFINTEVIRLNGQGVALFSTAAAYIANTTWYRIKITRSISGVFSAYIKGGAFGNVYQLVSVAGGSGTNPATNTTYTTSNYFLFDLDAGDRVTNIKLFKGVI